MADKTGRLANRLIVFANLIAIAAERNALLSNPAFDEYADLFTGTSQDLLCRFPKRGSLVRPSPWMRRKLFSAASAAAARSRKRVEATRGDWIDLSDQNLGGLTFLTGYYFRAPDLVRRHADTILEFLRPIAPIREEVRSAVSDARSGIDLLIGIHIRHGDFETWRDGKHFLTLGQYAKAMERVADIRSGERLRFLVCTDGERNAGDFGGLPVVFGPGSAVSDLYALAQCDLLIHPEASTFAPWASWYGRVPSYAMADPVREITASDFAVCDPLPG